MNIIKFGFSPCPNDTFIMDALVNGKIDTGDYKFEWIIEDVEALNKSVLNHDIHVSKLSFATYAKITETYQLLDSGSALGKACGPLLISNGSPDLNNLSNLTVAIPGKNTTANLLLSIAYPQIRLTKEVLFSEIENLVLNKQVDLGLIIHENRFTYESKGLSKVRDLGNFWEEETGKHIPLGGFAIQRGIDAKVKSEIQDLLRQSVEFAFENPKSSENWTKSYAQELSSEVINSHIKLYVNEFSIQLGSEGKESIELLLQKAVETQNISKIFRPIFL